MTRSRWSVRVGRGVGYVWTASLLLLATTAPLSAQEPVRSSGTRPLEASTALRSTSFPLIDTRSRTAQDAGTAVTPGGAFLRSLLVPGWGHVAARAHLRGAVYVAAQSGAFWMLAKSMARHGVAIDFRATEYQLAQDRLRAAGVTSPDSLALLAEADPRVEDWDDLVSSRATQVEDWAALSIFLVLLGATDAFVAAHLMDRPEPLTFGVLPAAGGRWDVSVSVPVGPGAPR